MTAVVDAYAAPDAVADAFEEDMRDMSIVDTTDEEKVIFERFEILYDQWPAAVKSSQGQQTTLSGKVVLHTSSVINLRGLHISCHGQCLVSFVDEDDSDTERPWSSVRSYLNLRQTIWGNDPSSRAYFLALEPGNYSFPFAFKIPAGLPPSFEGDHGYIRYFCKVTIDKPWEARNETRIAAFNVMNSLDLNSLPTTITSKPKEARDVREANSGGLCGLCQRKGEVSIYMRTDRKGYVPGEQIVFDLHITNKSGQELTKWEIRLLQRTIYIAHDPGDNKIRKTSSILSFNLGDETRVKGGGCLKIDGESLTIPPLPPSCLHECDIMEVEYALKFEGYLNHMEEKFRAVIPLTIGTIPLASQWDKLQQQYNSSHGIRDDEVPKKGVKAAPPPPLIRKSNRSSFTLPISRVCTEDPDQESLNSVFYGHRPHYATFLYE